MNKRLEWKVGAFVLTGIVFLGVLMLAFSKGLTFFQPTYRILLTSTDVAGLKPGAAVMMSGVQVGTVSDIRLAEDGKSVTLPLRILKRYAIYKDAKFTIEQSGVLSDQYVAIRPTRNEAGLFHDNDPASAEPSFIFTETARSASGLVDRVDETARRLNEIIADLRRLVLNERTLTNVSVAVENLRNASERAASTVDDINSAATNLNGLLIRNGPLVDASVTNLADFSEDLKSFSAGLKNLLATNGPAVDATMKNLESSTETLRSLVKGIEEGRGVAGKLVGNEQLSATVSQIASNLSITTSNLNSLGLWGILWKKKQPRENLSSQPLASPKQQTP